LPALETYRAKRDFGKTAEPRGGRVAKPRSKVLKFVIQRHDATRLHYDFRLELDGVYKSWAVTKVPSLDPATKRLAVEVEDHPIEYGTFEGTIPQGQYGGGTVQLWDRGTWEPQGDDAQGDLKNGHIKIILHGDRLHGRWALIRMKDDPAKPGRRVRHNWLLIKEKDEDARPGEPDTLMAADTSVATGRTLEEIANAKKPRIWNSNRGTTADSKKKSRPLSRRKTPPKPKKRSPEK
jgi:bifunctional non-homologous end joining protein LigD